MRNGFAMVAIAAALVAGPALAANMIAADGVKATTTNVTVASVSADKAGYVVVHEAVGDGTKPGKVLGHAPVQAGNSSAITITLAKPVAAGAKLVVMLHEEMDGNAKYDKNDKRAKGPATAIKQVVTVQ